MLKKSVVAVLCGLLLTSCIATDDREPVIEQSVAGKIVKHQLPYNDKLRERAMQTVDLIVIHSTELPTMALAREFGEKIHYDSGTGNSGHYYVDKDGSIYQYVNDDRVANHVKGYNERSIGIEIVNTGRYPDWYTVASQNNVEYFAPEQIEAVIKLVNMLSWKYPSIKAIAGHEDLDLSMMSASDDPQKSIRRKVDPGRLFPWQKLLSEIDLERIKEQ